MQVGMSGIFQDAVGLSR